ncbi:MAG: helix-turn-helix domain-containing protein [Terriglobales bacterium]|jgi:excisionase family DNA binding protein
MTDSEHNAIAEVTELASYALRRVKTAAEISPRLLDLADAARYLSMGDKALRELIRKGELPYVQTIAGRSPYLLDIRDLDKWIEKSKRY